jgi:hypothetical protein
LNSDQQFRECWLSKDRLFYSGAPNPLEFRLKLLKSKWLLAVCRREKLNG